MPSTGNTLRSLQGRQAAAKRWGSPDCDEAAREYAAAKLADYISKTVNAAPPLTAQQRDKLALLLSGGAADAAAS